MLTPIINDKPTCVIKIVMSIIAQCVLRKVKFQMILRDDWKERQDAKIGVIVISLVVGIELVLFWPD